MTNFNNKSEIFHKSVLVKEVLNYLVPKPGSLYIDATFGGGGHTRAILQAEPTCSVVAIDWDQEAITTNAPNIEQEFGDRFKIIWGNFSQLYKLLKKEKISKVDGILADFGTSQFQIHQKAGFSFQSDTPLDMRMSPGHQRQTAADIINNASEKELLEILYTFGEEPQAKKIVRALIAARSSSPIITTRQLAHIIESVVPVHAFKHQHGIHPATKTFQALRIAVNHELENIQNFLQVATEFLKTGGRFVCISFHSLEDRLVKNFFKNHRDQYEILTNKPITASEEEVTQNPSSRSAKLRAAQKL
jgi:16S rRNA (cytosine1402-N4)-methyltransferase